MPEFAAISDGIGAGPGYVVGGFVRDAIAQGRPASDLDLAVAGDAGPVAEELARRLGGTPVLLDEQRQVWRVVLKPQVEGGLATIDVASIRGGSIEWDLVQRDFSVDAMAIRVDHLEAVIDPLGGLEDLGRGALELINREAFQDDPVRLLRAARLTAQHGLNPSVAMLRAMRRDAALLKATAPERQREELMRLLGTEAAFSGLALLDRTRVLDYVLPELVAGRDFAQPAEHHWDVLRHQLHTVKVIERLVSGDPVAGSAPGTLSGTERQRWELFWSLSDAEAVWDHLRPRAPKLKLAGLLHDIGKPGTYAVHDGRVRFFGHPELGAKMTEGILERLRFSKRDIREVAALVRDHLRPGQLAAPGEAPTQRALGRFFRDLGDLAVDLLVLQWADAEATMGPRSGLRNRAAHVAFIDWMLGARDALRIAGRTQRRVIDGRDIMRALDLEPGPTVGRILSAVEEAFWSGEIETQAEALHLAREVLAESARED